MKNFFQCYHNIKNQKITEAQDITGPTVFSSSVAWIPNKSSD